MKIIETHIVPALEKPIRLSDYLVGIFEQLPSRKSTKKALKRKEIQYNGSVATSGVWVTEGATIQLLDLESQAPKIYEIDLPIIYEDDYFAVVNKPAGLVTSGNQFRTLSNSLSGNVQPSPLPDAWKYPKPVHRLDSATSGLVVVSKTSKAHLALSQLFEKREIQKTYQAIVVGKTPPNGTITQLIDNQEATTHFETLKTIPSLRNGFLSLVRLSPKTGRTHQLRIHLSGMGHPIVGDTIYGEKGKTLLHKGLFLVAVGLAFEHPISRKGVTIEIEVPRKFGAFLEREERRWGKFRS